MLFVSKRDRSRGVAARVPGILTGLACCLLLACPLRAQSLTDGPLASPEMPASSKATKGEAINGKSATHAKTSAAKTHAARTTRKNNAKADDLDGGSEPNAAPTAKPTTRKPMIEPATDPVSLGMKWNGSNDSAEQTRIQNYGGTAPGTGASVGLNYHF